MMLAEYPKYFKIKPLLDRSKNIIFPQTIGGCFIKGLLLILLLSTLISVAEAQSPLDLFKGSVNGVAVWESFGLTNHNVDNVPIFGKKDISQRYGFEIFTEEFNLGEKNELEGKIAKEIENIEADSIRGAELNPAKADTLLNLRNGLRDIKRKDSSYCTLVFGVGIDYSYTYRPSSDSLDIRTPTLSYFVSTYLNMPDNAPGFLKYLYIGGTAGLANIANGTAYDKSQAQLQITGTTLAYEIAVGIFPPFCWEHVQPVLEVSWQNLAFDGVQYKMLNTGNIPVNSALQKRLDFSGFHVTIALQIGKSSD